MVDIEYVGVFVLWVFIYSGWVGVVIEIVREYSRVVEGGVFWFVIYVNCGWCWVWVIVSFWYW